MVQSFDKVSKVTGKLYLPGDKSISHRALLISSLVNGKSLIKNLPEGEDVKSTLHCLKALGVEFESSKNELIVKGKGYKGYSKPSSLLNAGNSGTTARLLTGILSAQNFESHIIGDASLSNRPMKRVIEPLTQMGAKIKSSDKGKLPIHISPVNTLQAIKYRLPVASAQVKSAILLAGLHLDEVTDVIESSKTRNHTENLLGLKVIKEEGNFISSISKKYYPEPKEYIIPGDISSAMFFIVLALLTKGSELQIKNVSLNLTRIECLNLLAKMGGNITIEGKGVLNNEPYGDIIIKSSQLINVKIDKEIIPLIVDEIPALTIAGIFAEGAFELKGASELRIKESDRIKAMCSNLLRLGLEVLEYDDGYRIDGSIEKLSGSFHSFNDHRIAMAFAILSLLLKKGGKVEGFGCVSVSNPDFINHLISVTD